MSFIYFYNVTLEGLHFSVAQILSYLMTTPQNKKLISDSQTLQGLMQPPLFY